MVSHVKYCRCKCPHLPKNGFIPPLLKEVHESARAEDLIQTYKIPRPTATPFKKGRIEAIGRCGELLQTQNTVDPIYLSTKPYFW